MNNETIRQTGFHPPRRIRQLAKGKIRPAACSTRNPAKKATFASREAEKGEKEARRVSGRVNGTAMVIGRVDAELFPETLGEIRGVIETNFKRDL